MPGEISANSTNIKLVVTVNHERGDSLSVQKKNITSVSSLIKK